MTLMINLLILLLTIQSGEAALQEKSFAEVSDLLVTESGVYVADLKMGHIIKFDHDGVEIARNGRQGRGPGEFLMGPNRLVKAGDRLLVLDQLPNVLNIFNPDLSLSDMISDRDVFVPAYDAFLHADSLLYLASSPIFGEDFGIYNLRGGLEHAIEIPDLARAGLRGTFRGFSTGDRIALLWTYINRLDTFTSDGERISTCQIAELPDEVEHQIQQFDFPTENMTEAQAAIFSEGVYVPYGRLINGVTASGEHLLVQYGNQFNVGRIVLINQACEIIHELEFPANQRIMFYDEQRSRLYYTYEYATKVGYEEIELAF